MQIQNMSIDAIKPYVRNAKKHPQTQVDNVAESIRQFGFVQPIVIDGGGCIIIGHCRYEASKRLGLEEVPCVMLEDLTDDEVRKLRLLDNKLNESPWDMSLLEEEISDLDFSDFDIDFNIDSESLDDVLDDLEKDDVIKDGKIEVTLTFTNRLIYEQSIKELKIDYADKADIKVKEI